MSAGPADAGVSAPRRSASRLRIVLAAAAFSLALDVVTKDWAERALADGRSLPVVGDVFRLTLGYNTGVAFGLWQDGGGPLLLLTGAIIAALLVALLATPVKDASNLPRWPLGLMLGGALANFADRLPDGRVTDFLDVGVGAGRWPTFNLADTAIVLGVAAFAALSLLGQPGRADRSGA